MVKIRTSKFGLVHNEFNFFLRLRHTWFGGNQCARDGKGTGFEADRTCFFFQTGNNPF